jgi:hypothetical protein
MECGGTTLQLPTATSPTNPGPAALDLYSLLIRPRPALANHEGGVVSAMDEVGEVGAPRRDADDYVMGAGHKLTLITSEAW